MKIKNQATAVLLLFGLLAFPALQSCNKYPDGNGIHLRSRTERVANTWKVDNYKVNGNDATSFVQGYSETFSKDGAYSYAWGMFDGTGKWAFQNDDKEIKINGTSSQSSRTLVILKLEEKSFWYYYMDGNDKKEFHMIPKE